MSWDTFEPNYEASASYTRYTTGERWQQSAYEAGLILSELGRCYEFIAARMAGEQVAAEEGPNLATKNRILTQENGSYKEALLSVDSVCETLLEIAHRLENAVKPIRGDLR